MRKRKSKFINIQVKKVKNITIKKASIQDQDLVIENIKEGIIKNMIKNQFNFVDLDQQEKKDQERKKEMNHQKSLKNKKELDVDLILHQRTLRKIKIYYRL